MEFLLWLLRFAVWQNFIRIWPNVGPARIPQFILDLKHGYVEENYSLINSLEDPQEALCNQGSLQRESLPPIPKDLFKHLFVDNNRAEIVRREGWKNAQGRFTEILECPAALDTCKEFSIDICRHDGGNYCEPTHWWGYLGLRDSCPYEPEMPPKEVPQLLVETLGMMPNLMSLEWKAPYKEPALSVFRQAFNESNLLLPSVRTLRLGPNLEFLIPLANNIQLLMPSNYYGWNSNTHHSHKNSTADSPEWRFLHATKGLTHLTELHLSAIWTLELIQELYNAQPNLQSLTMKGGINPSGIRRGLFYEEEWTLGNDSNTQEGEDLREILPALAPFESLRNLTLPDVYLLDMDLPGLPMCGNAYFSASGAKRGRFETLKGMSATERAAKIVLSKLTHLQVLCFGSDCVKNMGEELSWPWTNRVREYLLEASPRWERFASDESPEEDPNGPVFWRWDEDRRWLVDGELSNLFDDEEDMMENYIDGGGTWPNNNNYEAL